MYIYDMILKKKKKKYIYIYIDENILYWIDKLF